MVRQITSGFSAMTWPCSCCGGNSWASPATYHAFLTSTSAAMFGPSENAVPAIILFTRRVSNIFLWRAGIGRAGGDRSAHRQNVMVGCLAMFAAIVTFDNLADDGANFEFVRHVLSMDGIPGKRAVLIFVNQPDDDLA